jgi:hypothetical protein
MSIKTKARRTLTTAGALAVIATTPASAIAASTPMHHTMTHYCTTQQVKTHHTKHCKVRHSMKHTMKH